jgi:hypothetical protein
MNQPTDKPSGQQTDRSTGVLIDLLAVALLWALILVCFWRIALAGRVLAGGDVFTYFYPYWAEASRAICAGRLPLWNPYLFLGAPFLANSQVGVFYPLNWPLWLLLPPHRSVHLSIVLHLCLAALNAYLWGRRSLRLGRVGAWTVGAVFALGGYLGAQVEHVNQLQGLAWMPLMLMLWDDLFKSANRKSANLQISRLAIAGLACIIGLVLLAGHTQTAFISLVGLAAYGLGPAAWQAVRRGEWRSLARRGVGLAVAVGLGLALAAVQLVPTGELSRLSVRAGGLPFNERVSFSLSPLYLARAFLPAIAEPVPPEHIEHVTYVGIAGLVLAAVGLVAAPRATGDTQHATRNTEPVSGSRFQVSGFPSHASRLTHHVSRITHYASRLTHHASRITHHALPSLPPTVLLVALGLFFSLGLYNPLYLLLARFVPGFAHFRVPARWLALTAIGVAALAGWGADVLYRRGREVSRRGVGFIGGALLLLAAWAVLGVRLGEGGRVGWPTVAGWAVGIVLALGLLLAGRRAPRLATLGLLALILVELFAAGSALPHSRATASQAFTSLRPAIAHLLFTEEEGGGAPARFVSMSDITFDPGDLPEIKLIYGPQLSADALYEYVIAAKHKEVLSPNLPLAFGVPAVDGYDGGVLPLARYVALQRLFLPPDQVSMDGRLRENLSAIPDGRWLSLFNVRYVVTDKLHDAWLDDVFYDLQFGARLGRGERAAVAEVPSFAATALGIVSHLEGSADLPDGTLAGLVEVGFSDGLTRTFELRTGQHTAEGLYGPGVAHALAPVGGHYYPATSGAEGQPVAGNDYVARLRWPEPSTPTEVVVRGALPLGELVVRGVSVIDERIGGFQSLVLSDRGRFRLAHSGDIKIYENLEALDRAFLVHRAKIAADDEAALALMQDPAFDPAAEVVLSAGGAGETRPGTAQALQAESVRVLHHAPEQVVIAVDAQAPGILVLTDAWYPGWQATVDGEPVPVRRADLLFRAVAVEAGEHRVVFSFRPASLRVGAGITLASLVALGALVALALSKARQDAIMGVTSKAANEQEDRR